LLSIVGNSSLAAWTTKLEITEIFLPLSQRVGERGSVWAHNPPSMAAIHKNTSIPRHDHIVDDGDDHSSPTTTTTTIRGNDIATPTIPPPCVLWDTVTDKVGKQAPTGCGRRLPSDPTHHLACAMDNARPNNNG
jgi:hypothetical protein